MINDILKEICNNVINNYCNSLYIHNIMQYKIKEWADYNGYECELEYEVKKRDKYSKRKGKIDIRLVIAGKTYLIEIDSANKHKSIYKLLNNEADFRIWIRADNIRMREYVDMHKEELKDIIVIPIEKWI